MNGESFINGTIWVLSLVLSFVFFYEGLGKLAAYDPHVLQFTRWNVPLWALTLSGLVNCLGALFLVIPRFAILGAIILGVEKTLSAVMHYSLEESDMGARALVFVFILLGIALMRVRYGNIEKHN